MVGLLTQTTLLIRGSKSGLRSKALAYSGKIWDRGEGWRNHGVPPSPTATRKRQAVPPAYSGKTLEAGEGVRKLGTASETARFLGISEAKVTLIPHARKRAQEFRHRRKERDPALTATTRRLSRRLPGQIRLAYCRPSEWCDSRVANAHFKSDGRDTTNGARTADRFLCELHYARSSVGGMDRMGT